MSFFPVSYDCEPHLLGLLVYCQSRVNTNQLRRHTQGRILPGKLERWMQGHGHGEGDSDWDGDGASKRQCQSYGLWTVTADHRLTD